MLQALNCTLCVTFGSLPGSSVLSFVIYGNHICVVHILSIACADSTRNLLITEVIISVLACERSGMYVNSTTFLTTYFHVLHVCVSVRSYRELFHTNSCTILPSYSTYFSSELWNVAVI